MRHMWRDVRGNLAELASSRVQEPRAVCTGTQQEAARSDPANWASVLFFNRGRRIALCLGLCRLLQCLHHAERDPIEPVDGHGPDDANAVPETGPRLRFRASVKFEFF